MTEKMYIGVDVGGTKIVAALVDGKGGIYSRSKMATPLKAQPQDVYRIIHDVIEDVLKDQNLKKSDLSGIGAGIPGVVLPDQTTISITPNINLAGFNLVARLKKAFSCPVVLGNDVNLGLLGEKWLGVARTRKNVIGIFPGTGVGGAIIINDKLILGAQGAAGELGHMIMDQNSKVSSAGVFGSVEALASRRAIEREIRKNIKRGGKSILSKVLDKDLSLIKSSMILHALEEEDALVVDIVDNVCITLGKTCISLRHILNPEMIVFGGGLIEACGSYMLPEIRKISQADPFFKNVDQCQIVASQLADDAVMLGAVALIKEAVGDKDFDKGSYYPPLKVSLAKGLYIRGQLHKEPLFIRADNRVKTLGDTVSNKKISLSDVEKACKKNPQVLIMGYKTNKPDLAKSSREYLKECNVDVQILPLKSAVELYNKSTLRKAFLTL